MRVVISDDSLPVRNRLKAYLENNGYQVVGIGSNGKEGCTLCAQHKPDIAIFDISMPVMNGDVAAIRVKAEKLAKYVIIASSQMQEATIKPFLAKGVRYIAKPFYEEPFIKALNRILAEAS